MSKSVDNFDESTLRVYNVAGSELVVKIAGQAPRGRGMRKKVVSRPRPLQMLKSLERQKLAGTMQEDLGAFAADEGRYCDVSPKDVQLDVPDTKFKFDENNNEECFSSLNSLNDDLSFGNVELTSTPKPSGRTKKLDSKLLDQCGSKATIYGAGIEEKMKSLSVSDQQKPSSDAVRAVFGELERIEQIVYNMDAYRYLHPEVICMCDGLKKNGHKFQEHFPSQTKRIFSYLRRITSGKMHGIHSGVVKHLISSGVVPVVEDKTIAELSAGTRSSRGIKEALTDILENEVVEEDRLLTNARLAALSNKTLHDALVSAVHSREDSSPSENYSVPVVRESYASLSAYAEKLESRTRNSSGSKSKKVSFSNETETTIFDPRPVHSISVAPLRKPGDRINKQFNPPATFTLKEKLKMFSDYPPAMLEGFLKDCHDSVSAVQHLVDCLQTEVRYMCRTVKHGFDHGHIVCMCKIGDKSYPTGSGKTMESAKAEAALNVLVNVLKIPREKFLKPVDRNESDQQHLESADPADDMPLVRTPSESNHRLPGDDRSASSAVKNSPKPNHLSKKLRLMTIYPTPELEGYLLDLTDPVASVTYISQCLELEPGFVDDVVTDNDQGHAHSSIVRIGNLAFTPGFGPDLKTANCEAALNAMHEILQMASKN